jgi:hypothetical protein
MMERTKVFILSNEKPDSKNPDVSPYRCSYCGELAIIERETVLESEVVPMAQAVYCDCEDASTESTLKREISELHSSLSAKTSLLNEHVETKTFDSDTRMMRYEDAVTTLKIQFGIEL